MSRREEYSRISAMAGYDENGCILPPPAGASIDRSSSQYWRTAPVAADGGYQIPSEMVEALREAIAKAEGVFDWEVHTLGSGQ